MVAAPAAEADAEVDAEAAAAFPPPELPAPSSSVTDSRRSFTLGVDDVGGAFRFLSPEGGGVGWIPTPDRAEPSAAPDAPTPYMPEVEDIRAIGWNVADTQRRQTRYFQCAADLMSVGTQQMAEKTESSDELRR